MESALIPHFGGPEVLAIAERELPAPGIHEVTVRVEVAGVNPLDLKIAAGAMQQVFPVALPYAPGTDFSGVVEAVGAGVSGLRPGDRVVGRTAPSAGGAFARRVVVAASELCVLADDMSFEQAASLPTTFGTASQALFDVGRLAAGERVLVHAGAGGVGTMAIQLAHHAGAFVIATASERNAELVRSLGADQVVDYRTVDFSSLRGVDLVLDTLGGETLEKSWQVLGTRGRIATLADFAIRPRGGNAGAPVFFATATPYLPDAMARFRAGELQVIVDAIFPFAEARSALEKVATGHARGKVLIRIGG